MEKSRPTEAAQAQFIEAEKKIEDAARRVQNEFLKTFEDIGREVMSCAAAEVERGRKLSEKLTSARSVPDAMAAYQEWLSEEMSARASDANRFMSNSQKFMDASTRMLSKGWSGTVGS
jgi:Phasin protein